MAEAMSVAGLTVPAGSAVRHTMEIAELVVMRQFIGLRATRGGLLHTVARLGARVKSGDVLARIYNDLFWKKHREWAEAVRRLLDDVAPKR